MLGLRRGLVVSTVLNEFSWRFWYVGQEAVFLGCHDQECFPISDLNVAHHRSETGHGLYKQYPAGLIEHARNGPKGACTEPCQVGGHFSKFVYHQARHIENFAYRGLTGEFPVKSSRCGTRNNVDSNIAYDSNSGYENVPRADKLLLPWQMWSLMVCTSV